MNQKKAPLSAFVLMLVAAMVGYGSGCASLKGLMLSNHEKSMFDSFRNQVQESVSDPVRAEQLTAVGENVVMELHDYFNKISKLVKKCNKIYADYDTPPEQLADYFMTLEKHRKNMREALLNAHAQAVTLSTDSEWKALFKRNNSLKDFVEKHPELF